MTMIKKSAGATSTSNLFPKIEVTRTPTIKTSVIHPTSRTEPMADPYDPEPGRAAQRAYRDRVGQALTTAILGDDEELSRTRDALRHANEGDLRTWLDDT